jgi:uncharacterized protein (UPF0332 family)
MEDKFKRCLERKQIYEDPTSKNFVHKEIEAMEQDILTAMESLKAKRYKWSTIQAYYAMFHGFRALLYSAGYRERSHYCLVVAIQKLFVESGNLDEQFIKRFMNIKTLREKADYALEFSEEGAERSVKAATDLAAKIKNI